VLMYMLGQVNVPNPNSGIGNIPGGQVFTMRVSEHD
jgi:hypothetical protein